MPDPPGTRESLEALRSQVDAAHATAERLVRDAEQAARAQVEDVPPQGWADPPPSEEPASTGTAVEALQAIAGLLQVIRSAVPPELADQFAGALRELLRAVRALIDYSIERLEAPPGAPAVPPEVEDIPID